MKPKSIMDRAIEYCDLLTVGSEIVDDTDGPVVADFRHLIHALLFRRDLYLEKTARGQIVTDRAPWEDRIEAERSGWRQRAQPLNCTTCKRSWFSCDHGVNTGVVVSGLAGPVLPSYRPQVKAAA